jgi:hypothetical protein
MGLNFRICPLCKCSFATDQADRVHCMDCPTTAPVQPSPSVKTSGVTTSLENIRHQFADKFTQDLMQALLKDRGHLAPESIALIHECGGRVFDVLARIIFMEAIRANAQMN